MRRAIVFCIIFGTIVFRAGTGSAMDMRAASQKAQAAYEAALSEAKLRREQILQDQTALQQAISDMQSRVQELQDRVNHKEKELSLLIQNEEELTLRRSEKQEQIDEYAAVVHQVSRDLHAILERSQFTARWPERLGTLESIMDPHRFPGIDDIKALADLFFEEMRLTGEVERFEGTFVGRDGVERTGSILTVGPFCTVYQDGGDVGFLRYDKTNRRFVALGGQLPWRMRHGIQRYITGESDTVYIDPSIGPALEHVAQHSTFLTKLKKGGILIWPILAIGVVAFLLICERLIFLHKVHANTDRLMGRVNKMAIQEEWERCHRILSKEKDSPVSNVLKAGLGAIHKSRETLENILNEAILKELPRLERFLPLLSVMAAVSPLLGLLGTVTGMITTFQVISLYGTGNPRLMAGGISEALITTMLGLAVAIPVMLAHAFLRRRIEHIAGDMEEKALTLSNIICRESTINGQADPQPSRVIAS